MSSRYGSEETVVSTIGLPTLRPPEDGLIGLLFSPPTATLHRPFSITLQVQNRHPALTADLMLQVESSDAFVIAGPRMSKLPALLSESSVEVRFHVVPLLCGHVKLPNFKVFDRRKLNHHASVISDSSNEDFDANGTIVHRPVKVVDQRRDERNEEGMDLPLFTGSAEDGSTRAREGVTILVLSSA